MIPSNLRSSLNAIVRASVAKTKDVALRAESPTASNSAGGATASEPVHAAAALTAIIAESPGATSQAVRALLALRGKLDAVIVANLGGTRYLVEIDGEQTTVVLEGASIPAGRSLEAGTDIRLVPAPRPTDPHSDPESANAAGRTVAALSEAGKLIGEILGHESAHASREPGHVTTSLTPLTSDPTDPHSLAAGLRAALSESGLFYESHLAQWAEGKRSIETLQREPQATQATQARNDVARTEPATSNLVREQLHTLNTQQVAWTGPLWPGQQGDILIGREPEPEREHPGERHIWRATLGLEMPNLGRVDVKIALSGPDLALSFKVVGDAVREQLDASAPTLVDRLAAQGLRPRAQVATEDADG